MVNSLDKSMSQNGLSSLTGFAAREGAAGDLAWSWELRSVNARGLDLRLRLPEAAQSLDQPVRGRLSAALSRGAVNVTLKLRSTGGARLPQPSDAGGPVFDNSGAVLGMLLPRKDGNTQVLPPEVNFSLDATQIVSVLADQGITAQTSGISRPISPVALTRRAADITVLVSCW